MVNYFINIKQFHILVFKCNKCHNSFIKYNVLSSNVGFNLLLLFSPNRGDNYHMFEHNCNSFSSEVAMDVLDRQYLRYLSIFTIFPQKFSTHKLLFTPPWFTQYNLCSTLPERFKHFYSITSFYEQYLKGDPV